MTQEETKIETPAVAVPVAEGGDAPATEQAANETKEETQQDNSKAYLRFFLNVLNKKRATTVDVTTVSSKKDQSPGAKAARASRKAAKAAEKASKLSSVACKASEQAVRAADEAVKAADEAKAAAEEASKAAEEAEKNAEKNAEASEAEKEQPADAEASATEATKQ